MSRVANAPILIPAGVEVTVDEKSINVKGKLGEHSFGIAESLNLDIQADVIRIKWDDSIKNAKALAGTARASISNIVIGVSE